MFDPKKLNLNTTAVNLKLTASHCNTAMLESIKISSDSQDFESRSALSNAKNLKLHLIVSQYYAELFRKNPTTK